MKKQYNPHEYWQERLSSGKLDVALVGHISLGLEYNRWLYFQRFHALWKGLQKTGINIRNKSILDIGVGSGAYIPMWQKWGVKYLSGVDITNVSTTTLQNKYPQFNFFQSDITSNQFNLDGEHFDIVTCFDVLFHIVDDDAFSIAIKNLSNLLQAGKLLIISDSFCKNPWGPTYHEFHRSYSQYHAEFTLNHLGIIHLEPIFFIMSTPLCGSNILNKLVSLETKIISWLGKRKQTAWVNNITGASLYSADYLLGYMFNSCPGIKYCFLQKNNILL